MTSRKRAAKEIAGFLFRQQLLDYIVQCRILNASQSLFLFCCLFLAPYVKVYVMEGKRCLAKKKTRTTRRTLEPYYQHQLEFKVEFTGKTLQVKNQITFVYCVLILCKDGLVIRAPLHSGQTHGSRTFPMSIYYCYGEMSQICKVLHF